MKRASFILALLLYASVLHESRSQGMATIKADYSNLEFAKLSNGKSLTLDLYAPKSGTAPAPLIVYIHPGGWSSGSSSMGAEHAAYLVPAGFAVASINYRLSGDSVFPAQINDCKGAIRWLRANALRYNLDAKNVGAFGHSAGAHLAALVGTSGGIKTASSSAVTMDIEGSVGGNTQYSSAVQAVADFFGPSNLVEFYKITTQGSGTNLVGCAIAMCPDKAKLASPTTYVSRTAPPFLIMHGTADDVVPFSQSQLMDSALRTAGANSAFTAVQGANHGFDVAWSKPEIQTAVVNFFTTYLKATTSVSLQTKNGEGLSVSPNPALDAIRVQFTLTKPERVRIALFTIFGVEVASLLMPDESPVGVPTSFSIALPSSLPNGAYFLSLRTPSFSLTKPVQVLR